MREVLSSINLLNNVCLSKDVEFVENDKVVVDTALADVCEWYGRELAKYVDKNLFFSRSPLPIAVGMSMTQKNLANRFNKYQLNIVAHNNICIVDDLNAGKNFDALNFAIKMQVDGLIVVYKRCDARLLTYYKKFGVNVADDGEVNFYDMQGITLVSMDRFYPEREEDIKRLFRTSYQNAVLVGVSRERKYKGDFAKYRKQYRDECEMLESFYVRRPTLSLDTREQISGIDLGNVALNKISSDVINLVGGTPNLVDKTRAFIVGGGEFPDNPIGANINFCGYEDIMYEVCAGMSLHGGVNVFCADYLSHSYRLFGLDVNPRVLFMFLEDDYNYLSLLRMDKRVTTFNAGNASEVAFAFEYAFATDTPTALVLTKELLAGRVASSEDIGKGGYIVDNDKSPNGVILASGKDVPLALEVKLLLKPKGVDLCVVSIPCTRLFDANLKLLNGFKMKSVVALDRSDNSYLQKYIPKTGAVINVEGETAESVAKKVYAIIKRNGERTDSFFD